ncbi:MULTISPECIES: alpha/beta fold hydrolase [Streptomyces]|uniref:Alpha/beta hydrolase n=1 Tax=Streptomyces tsukubensis (strain DSM 42081 / NBRC 108919 / NRRL 18488 / 9993) TaxID=1114943 RepID=I2N3G2_STRT9|nr:MULTISPECIES: alpha/beta hydrolase [Streptomyces]AZK95648.1 esterase [Streptomyces tsukubensis]EIF91559.1 esterase [Streptomyces tsukubensis NRRL18488]MYS68804.1 alpha/beta fold hydrolase [Streptomyces sp. SID5473]QKM68321.1 alpha/beta hydrolase [Streptomyces tsukubensis NRRL18488]TAI43137.1 alpha/beta hydrolase [Streptomyces tsukubensis]
MANFVLVAGAWLGSWAWDDVVPELRGSGHGVHPLTLSGLAEREDEPVGRQTHVRDIVDEVERLGLRDVVLVGHSYAGIPVGQAAELIGDRLARVVFVDANVPADGESFVSTWWEGPAKLETALAENGGLWAPLAAADCEGQGLTDDQVTRFVTGATPHPGVSLADPAVLPRPLGELPATYIKCLLDGPEPTSDVAELLKGERWRLVELDTGHWPMFSRPADLARILLDCAR